MPGQGLYTGGSPAVARQGGYPQSQEVVGFRGRDLLASFLYLDIVLL